MSVYQLKNDTVKLPFLSNGILYLPCTRKRKSDTLTLNETASVQKATINYDHIGLFCKLDCYVDTHIIVIKCNLKKVFVCFPVNTVKYCCH